MIMEKPRKIDIPEKPLIPKLAFDAHPIIEAMGYNKGLDAMSTWLEGEVPTVEEILNLFPMEWPKYKCKIIAESIHALITRKLTGKG